MNVKEVRFNSCVEKSLKKRTVEECIIGICAVASSRELARVSNEKHFFNTSLKGYEKVGLCGLGSLVNNKACYVSFDFIGESLVS